MLWPARVEACWLFLVHHFLSSAYASICMDAYLKFSVSTVLCLNFGAFRRIVCCLEHWAATRG